MQRKFVLGFGSTHALTAALRPGMTADFVRGLLLKPFAPTTAVGCGVGASEARAIISAMGGHIRLGSMFMAYIAVLLLAACGAGNVDSVRYRLTIVVDTPHGVRQGASIIEVRGKQNPDWLTPEGRGTKVSFRGEAAAVELPNGKMLFAVLRTESGLSGAESYPYFAFREQLAGSNDWLTTLGILQSLQGQSAPITGTEDLRADNQIKQVSVLPMLVTFENGQDARTVATVKPNDLAATFGPGYALRGIVVEVTEAPISATLAQRLPNLGKGSGYLEWRKDLPNSDPRRRLTRADFIRGMN